MKESKKSDNVELILIFQIIQLNSDNNLINANFFDTNPHYI